MLKSLNLGQIMLLGIPLLFMLSILTHFIFDLSGKNFLLGLFFPANESVFQHLKLFTVTGFLFYFVVYFTKKEEITPDVWFTSGLISMIITIFLMPMLHYLFINFTGKESILVDITIALIAVAIGQIVAGHYYNYGSGISATTAVFLMIFVIIIFALLTVYPPKTPFFKDSLTGTYTIFEN